MLPFQQSSTFPAPYSISHLWQATFPSSSFLSLVFPDCTSPKDHSCQFISPLPTPDSTPSDYSAPFYLPSFPTMQILPWAILQVSLPTGISEWPWIQGNECLSIQKSPNSDQFYSRGHADSMWGHVGVDLHQKVPNCLNVAFFPVVAGNSKNINHLDQVHFTQCKLHSYQMPLATIQN